MRIFTGIIRKRVLISSLVPERWQDEDGSTTQDLVLSNEGVASVGRSEERVSTVGDPDPGHKQLKLASFVGVGSALEVR